jgi:NADP-dependent 3-hydroxy acid dehydrogenase YdfG
MSTSTSPLALSNLFSVEGKVAVITGGGTGIGRMISESFAVNGAKVYITGRRKDVLEKTAKEINEIVKQQSGTGQVIA